MCHRNPYLIIPERCDLFMVISLNYKYISYCVLKHACMKFDRSLFHVLYIDAIVLIFTINEKSKEKSLLHG